MSTTVTEDLRTAPPEVIQPHRAGGGLRRVRKILITTLLVLIPLSLAGWFVLHAYRTLSATHAAVIPTTVVKKGDLTITVTATGDLSGGNSEVLIAPMVGNSELHLTQLLESGSVVKAGDVIAKFDDTEPEYKLKEAEADLAESDQKVIQANAQREAQQEEDSYALAKAKADVRLAELEVRKNPLVAVMTAKQNDMALAAAKDHLAQLEQNLANRLATNDAAIAMQKAAKAKAEVQANTARQNIEAMTLKAKRDGYVSIRQNTSQNFIFFGMTLPMYQVGDAVQPGRAVAEIPDLTNWELTARIGELDRGHIAVGQAVKIQVVALPGRTFTGKVKEIGGTTGPPWDRHFDCKLTLEKPAAELRPGMTAKLVITTDLLHQALWVPAQAVFESDGRSYVYVPSGSGFSPKDVKLVRRSESQAVISGVNEGQVIALASPDEQVKKQAARGSASQVLPK